MNESSTYQLVIAAFGDESAGVNAIARLVATYAAARAALPAAASIVKDAAGSLTIKETADIGAKQGATAGALAGGLLGLFSRRRGVVSSAALGALLGGAAAQRLDTGIPDARLEAIGQSLDVASSAAVVVVSDEAYEETQSLLAELGATLSAEPFDYDIDFVSQMKAGDYRAAMTSLANRAESMVAVAGGATGGLARQVTDKGSEIVGKEKSPDDISA
jgi:uncharacterized membrane protein